MNFGVKRLKCLLITVSNLALLCSFSFSVEAETEKRDHDEVGVYFEYETLTNTWNYQDLEENKLQEKIDNKVENTFLSSDERDYILKKYEISKTYTLENFSLLPDDNLVFVSNKNFVVKDHDIRTNTLNKLVTSSQNKTKDKSSMLLADEPLPPSEVGIYWSPARPDSHAPIGVMGEHIHSEGEIMVSYRYMLMEMDGSLVGTDDISDQKNFRAISHHPYSYDHANAYVWHDVWGN
jgi:hypothetical protein